MKKTLVENNEKRYCTVSESIVESFKEIKMIQKGKTNAMSLDDLWTECEKCKNEINTDTLAS